MLGYETESINRLVRTIAGINGEEECKAFLFDLCTIKELQDMAQRLDTAVMLTKGKNYREIAEEAGPSTATISRVRRALDYGNGGYKSVIARMTGEKDED